MTAKFRMCRTLDSATKANPRVLSLSFPSSQQHDPMSAHGSYVWSLHMPIGADIVSDCFVIIRVEFRSRHGNPFPLSFNIHEKWWTNVVVPLHNNKDGHINDGLAVLINDISDHAPASIC